MQDRDRFISFAIVMIGLSYLLLPATSVAQLEPANAVDALPIDAEIAADDSQETTEDDDGDADAEMDSDPSNPLQALPEPNPSASRRNASHWLGRNKFIRAHWVRLTPNGELKGSIKLLQPDAGSTGVTSLSISIYRKGEKVNEVETDENGSFVVPNLTSGVYALIARGPGGFAAYGLHALASVDDQMDDQLGQSEADRHLRLVQAVAVKETLEISTAAVPPTFSQLKSILRKNFTQIRSNFIPKDAYTELIREAETKKEPGAGELEGAEKFRGTKELESNVTDKTKTQAATSLSVHDVPLERYEDGLMLRGRLYGIDPDSGRSVEIEARSTTVTLIKDDKRVAKTVVRAEGEFDFYGLEPGVYSLIAVGDGGFGAVAFRAVVPAPEQANNQSASIRFVQAPLRDLDGNPPGLGNNIGSSFPFAMALIDDPRAIRDACQPDFVSNEFVGNEIMSGEILQPAMAQNFPPPAPQAVMGAPPAAGGFSGTPGYSGGGGGGGVGRSWGRIAGIGGLVVGITALGTRDKQPVSVFQPAPIAPVRQPVAPPPAPPVVTQTGNNF